MLDDDKRFTIYTHVLCIAAFPIDSLLLVLFEAMGIIMLVHVLSEEVNEAKHMDSSS